MVVGWDVFIPPRLTLSEDYHRGGKLKILDTRGEGGDE